jgi:predicted site-specific integrase-resolvase
MELTVKEFAAIERVDERTVRRWIAKGAVSIRRTPGGGIRIVERRSESRVTIFALTNSDSSGHPSQ